MADPRFFEKAAPMTLGEIAERFGATLSDTAKSDLRMTDVAPLSTAGEGHLSFLDNMKYKGQLTETKAAAVLVSENMVSLVPEGCVALVTPSPYKTYARIAQAFYPEKRPAPGIHPTAIIEEGASVPASCTVGEYAIIRKGAELGEACIIEAHAVIGEGVVLGAGCRIQSHCSVSHALIGDGTRLYPGCRIGQDGFGFAIDPHGFVKVPQLGRVVIGKGCEIGANTCIDRGAGPDTQIGDGTWLDNLVQIGHNVKTGKGCIIVSQSGVAGSTELGNFVALGGQAGLAGHLKVGDGAQIAAKTGLMSNVAAGETYMGSPGMPRNEYLRQLASLKKLGKKG
ncbi:MAG: UDP-3-O-(3-hydroxymyristoyl)glucosamine N-acyltransferase [Pseudobdellovibrionaceae bacterium]